jgi:DNA recombination protein RmuC
MNNFLGLFIVLLLLGIFAFLIFLFFKFRTSNESSFQSNQNFEEKIDLLSNEISEIENKLISVTTPINELNRFLGGNVSAGRLGEWNLESVVKDIMPDGSYEFQKIINPETTEQVDCAVYSADGLIIPIDSKLYSGQFKNYQATSKKTEQEKILKGLKTAILKDADDIAQKYIRQNTTSNYAILYIASEKMNDLVDMIEELRQECLSEKNVLIQGPNTMAAFLDTVKIGHHYLNLNETASKVAEVVRKINKQFKAFDESTVNVKKRLEASVKEVDELQTRINVLGRELDRGAEEMGSEK